MSDIQKTESDIRATFDQGDLHTAATRALTDYGPGVFGLLIAMTGDRHAASEVWSQFCEDLWRGISGFRWQSLFRTWVYRLARNACARYRKEPYQKRRCTYQTGKFADCVESVRASTLLHLRTEVKDRVRALRDELEEDDKTILILRVDRSMRWNDVAEVMSEPGARFSPATLRKRFERIKKKLAELAEREGIARR